MAYSVPCNTRLTADNIRCIEAVLAKDERVELVPNRKTGQVKVLMVKREEVK